MIYNREDYIRELANEIIEAKEDLHHILDAEISIDYLVSDEEKKRKGNEVYADIREVTGIWKVYCPYKYILTLYDPNIADLNDAQKQVLLYHELLHIHPDGGIRDHDVQDFYRLLIEYGFDWIERDTLKPIVGGD